MAAACRVRSGIRRHFVPCSSFKHPTGFLLVFTAPLFEKERDAGIAALVTQVSHPLRVYGTGLWPGLSAHNHPVDAG